MRRNPWNREIPGQTHFIADSSYDTMANIEVGIGQLRIIWVQRLVQLPVRFHGVTDTIGNILCQTVSIGCRYNQARFKAFAHLAGNTVTVTLGSVR
jgi:hypothetical protein